MHSDTDVDALLDELRYSSPLPVLVAVLIGAVLLGCLGNLITGAAFDLAAGLMVTAFPDVNPQEIIALLACTVLPCSVPLLILLFLYLYKLTRRQQPQITRTIVLVLSFAQKKPHDSVDWLKVPKIDAYDALHGDVQQALARAKKTGAIQGWLDGWHFDDAASPITSDAVTIVYDLVEWMVLREVADYGKHIYAGQGNLRPGDDFNAMPVESISLPRRELYVERRVNFFGQHGLHFDAQSFKLPLGSTVTLEPLERKHGVASLGVEAVNQVVVSNPAGTLTVTPSQIWRRAAGSQARRHLDKLFANVGGQRYDLEIRLQTQVRLRQWPFIWPWTNTNLRAYQRWLLELQEQFQRHMDWSRYMESDYQRAVIDTREQVNRLSGSLGDPQSSGATPAKSGKA